MSPFNSLRRAAKWAAPEIIRLRISIIGISVVLVILAGLAAASIELTPEFEKSIPRTHRYISFYNDYVATFGSPNTLSIVVETTSGANIYYPHFFEVLEGLTREVTLLEGVLPQSVRSLFTPNVSYISITEDGFSGSRVIPANFRFTESAIRDVEANIRRSNEVGRTVSVDLKSAMITAQLAPTNEVSHLDYAEFNRKLDDLKKRYEDTDIKIRIIGFSRFTGDVLKALKSVVGYFVAASAIIFALLYLFLRSVILSIIVIAVAGVAVAWELGIVHVLGYGLDPLSLLVPFLIFAIAVSHAVQMVHAWRIEARFGRNSKDAAAAAFARLFVPGSTALLANAVGFAVIMFIDIPMIEELGINACVGVSVMAVSNKLLLPALLSYVPADSEKLPVQERMSTVMRMLAVPISKLTIYPANLIAASVMVAAACFGAYKNSEVVIGDPDIGVPEFYQTSQYNQDLFYVSNHYQYGVDEVILGYQMEKDGCFKHEAVRVVDRVAWTLGLRTDVIGVNSIANAVRWRTLGNSEGVPQRYGVPVEDAEIAESLSGLNASDALFDADCSLMPITLYLKDHRAATLSSVLKQAEQLTAADGPGTLRLAAGNGGVMAATNESVRDAKTKMELALFLGVGALCAITFFSLRATLCVIAPLVTVTLLANAVMVYLTIGLKVSTLPVVALGVGVGVDYGIYLLEAILTRVRSGAAWASALSEGIVETGTAVVFTALTMSVAVLTWVFSPLKFQADMGKLLTYMFFVNMVGALVFVPALASLFLGSLGEKRGTVTLRRFLPNEEVT